ncbi:hypothetical protein PCE1_003553 [Barthelona sp. PCE]
MNRQIPTSNKSLAKKWTKRNQKLHKRRLASVKSSIDNKPPKLYRHVKKNLKRRQIEEERFATIERDNWTLLKKIASIKASKSALDNRLNFTNHPGTLNASTRRRELQDIDKENAGILKRLISGGAHYNHIEWDKHSKQHAQYLKNICEYGVDEDALATLEGRKPKPKKKKKSKTLRNPRKKQNNVDDEEEFENQQGSADEFTDEEENSVEQEADVPPTTTTTQPEPVAEPEPVVEEKKEEVVAPVQPKEEEKPAEPVVEPKAEEKPVEEEKKSDIIATVTNDHLSTQDVNNLLDDL